MPRCGISIFLFFFNFIKGFMCIYIVFLTSQQVKYGKRIVLIIYTQCIKLEESQSHQSTILGRFSFVSNATDFFIHSLNRLFFWKKCIHVAAFLQSGALYANIRHDHRTEYNWRKSECSKHQWSWGVWGVLRAQWGFQRVEHPKKNQALRIFEHGFEYGQNNYCSRLQTRKQNNMNGSTHIEC